MAEKIFALTADIKTLSVPVACPSSTKIHVSIHQIKDDAPFDSADPEQNAARDHEAQRTRGPLAPRDEPSPGVADESFARMIAKDCMNDSCVSAASYAERRRFTVSCVQVEVPELWLAAICRESHRKALLSERRKLKEDTAYNTDRHRFNRWMRCC